MDGPLVVFAQDECHLLWGDSTGYVWGRRGERTEIPIKNVKDRQPYYRALNLRDRDFVLMPRANGDGENTVSFMKRLQRLNPEKKLLIIWDGASYLASVGRPLNLFVRATARVPIALATPAGTVRILPRFVYVRWGSAPIVLP